MVVVDLYLVTEDAISEAIGERLVAEVGGGLNIVVRMGNKGNGYLKTKLAELGRVARACPVLMLTDLDSTECPPSLIRSWFGNRSPCVNMMFRVAVREVEAWLLADQEAFSEFTGVPFNKLPRNPETLNDPKRTILQLVKRYGRKSIKQDVLPAPGVNAIRGLGYNQAFCRFTHDIWSPERASASSESLMRARNRLAEFVANSDVSG